jgi:hypothetical protein
VTNLVINVSSDTTSASMYGCIEGVFLASVGVSACLSLNTAAAGINSTSSATYNIGGDASCIDRVIGGGDTATGNVRGLYDRTAAGSCDSTTGLSAFVQHSVVQDDGDVLILSDVPHSEPASTSIPWPYTSTAQFGGSWPAVTVTTVGNCIIWGPQSAYTNAYAAGGTFTPTGASYVSAPVAPCPPNMAVRGGSYLVFVRFGAPDADGDAVANALDNCTLVSNPDQFDADGDGFGNNCDADLNQSGTVTVYDYTILRAYLNTTRMIPDLSRGTSPTSGMITVDDYTILRNRLNTIPGPSGRRPDCVSSATCGGPPTPGTTTVPTPAANVY